MTRVDNYFKIARDNETVFRNVLRDSRDNRVERPGWLCIPGDLEAETELEVIFQKYSSGVRYGAFTITDFTVSEGLASIAFRDLGMGACLKYSVRGDTVGYFKAEYIFMH